MLLFFVAAVMLFFSAYAAAQRRVRAAPEFARLMLASAVYAIGAGLTLSQNTIGGMLAAVRLEYLGISTAPVFWLIFALAFSRVRLPKPVMASAVFFIPLLVVAVVWTNDLHHLYYARTWVRSDGPFPTFGFQRGPLYWINLVYNQACIVGGNVAVVLYAVRAPRFIRRQAIVIGIGSLGPWFGNIGYLTGLVPWGLDPLPVCMALVGCFSAFALFKLGLLELVPAARDRAIESLRDGFLVVDGSGRILDSNKAAGSLLGEWTQREGDPVRQDVPGGAELLGILGKGEAEVEFSVVRDRTRRLAAHSFPVRVGRGGKEGSGIVIRDITETASLLERLAEQAGTDELTRLPNRRRFIEYGTRELAVAVREGRPFSVALFDIDRFKDVNDRFGHAVGDAALREFAARLSRALREVDLVCRYGGEEFAAILPGTDAEDAFAAIDRIRRTATGAPVSTEAGDIGIRASAGVYSAFPDKESRLDAFLSAADGALYEAKSAGRDRTVLRGCSGTGQAAE
jgi:diguanylate cyclase (GGDEF)-like protein